MPDIGKGSTVAQMLQKRRSGSPCSLIGTRCVSSRSLDRVNCGRSMRGRPPFPALPRRLSAWSVSMLVED